MLLDLNMTNQKNLSQTEDISIYDPEITKTDTIYIILLTLMITGFGINITHCIYKRCKSNVNNQPIKIQFENKKQNTSSPDTNTENTPSTEQEQHTPPTTTTEITSIDQSYVQYDLSGEEVIISHQ